MSPHFLAKAIDSSSGDHAGSRSIQPTGGSGAGVVPPSIRVIPILVRPVDRSDAVKTIRSPSGDHEGIFLHLRTVGQPLEVAPMARMM